MKPTELIGNPAMKIALSPDGGFAFVAHFGSSEVSVVRTFDMILTAGPIAIGASVRAIGAR